MSRLFTSWRRTLALCLVAMMFVVLAESSITLAEETTGPSVVAATETSAATETTTTEAEASSVAAPTDADVMAFSIDNIVLMICAVLVIFMQAGFALVEAGLNSAKNCVNILFKNLMDFCIGALLFFVVGYGIMYPGNNQIIDGVFGFAQVGISPDAPEIKAGKLYPQVDFLFQVAFAATAATIVSGSVAGRIKFGSYIIYTAVITALIYPISGMWMWGGGWLKQMGFVDFAGSIVVHSVGGFAGLAGAMMLGPRIGRYINGKAVPMPGHNLAYAALGVFILIIGWYGFNPGSQLAFTGLDNIKVVMTVAVNTTLAACAGGVLAMIFSWIAFKKPDLTFTLNGVLAGLVGITANCHCVENHWAIVIGGIAGVLVCVACLTLDKLQIDDPVGAFPVHGVCGMWGGIATGIFGVAEGLSLQTQLIGTLAIGGWAFGTSLVMFGALKAFGLLRVSAEEEVEGLDINEHGMYAYPPQLVVDAFPGARPPASPHMPGVTVPQPSTVGA